jgi:hypothetical protein
MKLHGRKAVVSKRNFAEALCIYPWVCAYGFLRRQIKTPSHDGAVVPEWYSDRVPWNGDVVVYIWYGNTE